MFFSHGTLGIFHDFPMFDGDGDIGHLRKGRPLALRPDHLEIGGREHSLGIHP